MATLSALRTHKSTSNTGKHSMKCSLALLAAVLAAARLACVRGHGHLALPRARQVASYRPNVYIPHGNSVGWGGIRPISNPGVCGDPFQESTSNVASYPFNSNTPFVYTSGGLMQITLDLIANHGGRHSFRVCPSTTPSEACFGSNWLTAEGNPSGGQNPVNGKRYWYMDYDRARFDTQEIYTSQWRLPAGVSCANGCILQWKWYAYQNCALRCEDPSIDDPNKCGKDMRGNPQFCTGSAVPALFAEVFNNNCADIKINPTRGGSNPTTPTTPITPVTPTTPTTPSNPQPGCNWPGHCLGDTCRTWDDCDGDLTCTNGRCAVPSTRTPTTPTTPTNPITPSSPPRSPPVSPPPRSPPPRSPPNGPTPGCVDTFAACPGWRGQCHVPGVATYCPCMCGRTG